LRTTQVFQRFGSAWIPLEKKSLLAESTATHALPAFVGPERLASHHHFDQSKDMKVTGGEYGGCGRHSDRSWIVATVERAVWG